MRTAKVTSTWAGILLATLLLGTALPSMGQKKELRSAAYFLKVLADSKRKYELSVTGPDSLPPLPMADPLFRCYGIVKAADGTETLVDIMDNSNLDAATIALLDDAERAFQEGNVIEARRNYKRYLERVPNASRVMTFLGQSYVRSAFADSALYWYRRAVQTNPLDYMAQWFYASSLAEVDSAEAAVQHMLTAMVLNRTNPRMFAELDQFFTRAGYRYDPWSFQPRMEVKETGPTTVSIRVDSTEDTFLPYCMCQAAWKFEPDVATSVVDTSDKYAVLDRRERECLVASLGALLDDELLPTTTHPAIVHASRAAKERDFESYLYYEVILPRMPVLAYYLTASSREGLENYIRKYHVKKVAQR
ncbi:MAG: tetratricopeptide repeat protein [Bacteroidetes bacterium]|nr:tetratricopeptide repeat protein [Bacteroidota bacterium]